MPAFSDGIAMCQICGAQGHKMEGGITIIGVDLAKNVFQLHGAAADGTVVFRKKLSRLQFCKFMAGHPACVVAWRRAPAPIIGRARWFGLAISRS